MIMLSTLLTFFFLPIILLRYFNLVQISVLITETPPEELYNKIIGTYGVYVLLNVPFIILLAVYFAGANRIIKRLTFLQGIFFFADFAQGFKENIKDHLKACVIYALLFAIFEFLAIYFKLNNQIVWYYLIKIVHYFVVLPLFLLFFFLAAIYSDRFKTKFKSAIIIYLKFYPRLALFVLGFYSPLIVLLLPSPAIQLFYPLGYVFIGGTLFLLIFALGLNNIFDATININKFPTLYRKGLRPDNK